MRIAASRAETFAGIENRMLRTARYGFFDGRFLLCGCRLGFSLCYGRFVDSRISSGRFCKNLNVKFGPSLLRRFVDMRYELGKVDTRGAFLRLPDATVEIPIISVFGEFLASLSFDVFSDIVLNRFDDPCRFVSRVA